MISQPSFWMKFRASLVSWLFSCFFVIACLDSLDRLLFAVVSCIHYSLTFLFSLIFPHHWNKGKKYHQEQKEYLQQGLERWLRSAYFSCRGPWFSPQHPNGGSKPPKPPVPRDPVASSDRCRLLRVYGAHAYSHTHTHTHKLSKWKKFK